MVKRYARCRLRGLAELANRRDRRQEAHAPGDVCKNSLRCSRVQTENRSSQFVMNLHHSHKKFSAMEKKKESKRQRHEENMGQDDRNMRSQFTLDLMYMDVIRYTQTSIDNFHENTWNDQLVDEKDTHRCEAWTRKTILQLNGPCLPQGHI